MKNSVLKFAMIATTALCGTTALTACSTYSMQDKAPMMKPDAQLTVSGEAYYRERIMLAPESIFLATITDNSYSLISESRRVLKRNEMPVSFSMSVPAVEIDPNETYNVRVQIMDEDGQLRWTAKDVYTLNPRALNQDLGQVLLIAAGNDTAASSGMGPYPDMMGSTVYSDADLQGRTFQIEDVSGTGIIDRSNLTVRFGMDGQVSGASGCNTYFASYMRDETKLSLSGIGSTFKACAPALMNQEQKFLQTLSDVNYIERDVQGALILKTSDGRMLRGFPKA